MRPWKSWNRVSTNEIKWTTFLKSLWLLLNLSSHHVWNHSQSPASVREAASVSWQARISQKMLSHKHLDEESPIKHNMHGDNMHLALQTKPIRKNSETIANPKSIPCLQIRFSKLSTCKFSYKERTLLLRSANSIGQIYMTQEFAHRNFEFRLVFLEI